jgi:hypothetical protein
VLAPAPPRAQPAEQCDDNRKECPTELLLSNVPKHRETSMHARNNQKYIEPEELCARILKVRRSYFISRTDDYKEIFIDDEAQLEIDAVIEELPRRSRKHLGEAISISLLTARRYAPEDKSPTSFFGSVTLRGSNRSALAYLPSLPFWHMPDLIRDGAELLELTYTPMKQGFAHLLSLHLTIEPTQVPGR